MEIKVNRCFLCPFAGRSFLDYPACCHPGSKAPRLFDTSHTAYPVMIPEWCPLEKDAVTIKIGDPTP